MEFAHFDAPLDTFILKGDQFYIIVYEFNLDDDDFLQLQLYAEYNIEHLGR